MAIQIHLVLYFLLFTARFLLTVYEKKKQQKTETLTLGLCMLQQKVAWSSQGMYKSTTWNLHQKGTSKNMLELIDLLQGAC